MTGAFPLTLASPTLWGDSHAWTVLDAIDGHGTDAYRDHRATTFHRSYGRKAPLRFRLDFA
jgi:hypothetical protein